jgi:hypothetical protein
LSEVAIGVALVTRNGEQISVDIRHGASPCRLRDPFPLPEGPMILDSGDFASLARR